MKSEKILSLLLLSCQLANSAGFLTVFWHPHLIYTLTEPTGGPGTTWSIVILAHTGTRLAAVFRHKHLIVTLTEPTGGPGTTWIITILAGCSLLAWVAAVDFHPIYIVYSAIVVSCSPALALSVKITTVNCRIPSAFIQGVQLPK